MRALYSHLLLEIDVACGRTLICDPGAQKQLKSLGYICSNSQKYTVWVKIIHFSYAKNH